MSATQDFTLAEPPLLSRAQLDRDERLRVDSAALSEGWGSARVLRVSRRSQFNVVGDRLALLPAREHAPQPPEEGAVFLGEVDGAHLWAVRVPELDDSGGAVVADLRLAGHLLSAVDASLASTAVAMLLWQDRSRFAPWSGEPMALGKAGWTRVAPDGKEEFPRTDPAVICLVHDGADQVLLARQPIWPKRWFSVLAGFCEPGESLEQCVEREVSEEVGVEVQDVRYLGSQPWPFPRSLMIGFHAVADPAQPLVLADGEIEEARWFHRAEVVEALAHRRDWGEASDAPLLLPGSVSIARAMLESWAGFGVQQG